MCIFFLCLCTFCIIFEKTQKIIFLLLGSVYYLQVACWSFFILTYIFLLLLLLTPLVIHSSMSVFLQKYTSVNFRCGVVQLGICLFEVESFTQFIFFLSFLFLMKERAKRERKKKFTNVTEIQVA